jgi:hypothetical protein
MKIEYKKATTRRITDFEPGECFRSGDRVVCFSEGEELIPVVVTATTTDFYDEGGGA